MIQRWYIPSTSGDYRLEAAKDWKGSACCTLTVENPTPAEVEKLQAFLRTARDREWVGAKQNIGLVGVTNIKVVANIADAGALLVPATAGENPGLLTAVRSINGEVTATHSLESAAALSAAPEADAAVTVRRATPCCPTPETAAEKRASEVLRAFCTGEQWASWQRHGYLLCTGRYTGHRYRIAHRHSPLAEKQGRICADLTDRAVLHFHDSLLPPPEEVLGAKIILEHRENWLRHQATCLSSRFTQVFPNPLGPGIMDGIPDARLLQVVGGAALGWQLNGDSTERMLRGVGRLFDAFVAGEA